MFKAKNATGVTGVTVVRPATRDDAIHKLDMIQELAEYEVVPNDQQSNNLCTIWFATGSTYDRRCSSGWLQSSTPSYERLQYFK